MEKCPVCGKLMKFEIVYRNGEPQMEYECECGYYRHKRSVYYSTKTEEINSQEDTYSFKTSCK